MTGRRVLLYFAWSRPGETAAPLAVIEDRFPALFELRRWNYPKFESLADPNRFDQGVAGFLDHVQKPNFARFLEHVEAETGRPALQCERVDDDGVTTLLDDALLDQIDTIIVISFDSLRTAQAATPAEVRAVRKFLDTPDHLIFICPHHDIGEAAERRESEYLHHGDRAIPPRQGFGGFARTLLAGLGLPIENRFGLRPAAAADGGPAPIEVDPSLDDLGLLKGVETFNLHPHLPQLERIGESKGKLDVLARQPVDLSAPSHPFAQDGRITFDALLQSRPGVFPGALLVSDTTLWSSTAGGAESLSRLWSNVIGRRPRVIP